MTDNAAAWRTTCHTDARDEEIIARLDLRYSSCFGKRVMSMFLTYLVELENELRVFRLHIGIKRFDIDRREGHFGGLFASIKITGFYLTAV